MRSFIHPEKAGFADRLASLPIFFTLLVCVVAASVVCVGLFDTIPGAVR